MTAPTTDVPADIQASVDKFVNWLETGQADGLFAPDAFADISLPQWRIQSDGAKQAIAGRRQLHPQPGRVRVEKVLVGMRGYALKLEERWEAGGQQWYCREGFLCDLDDEGRITELSVYCTGDWDEGLVARHGMSVTLVRP